VETSKPTDKELFLQGGAGGRGPLIPNASFLKSHFIKEGKLHEQQTLYIVEEATKVLSEEPNLLEISGSTTGKFCSG
jgi:serine/threonine-protein phosphatase 2B catalytic subunit